MESIYTINSDYLTLHNEDSCFLDGLASDSGFHAWTLSPILDRRDKNQIFKSPILRKDHEVRNSIRYAKR